MSEESEFYIFIMACADRRKKPSISHFFTMVVLDFFSNHRVWR